MAPGTLFHHMHWDERLLATIIKLSLAAFVATALVLLGLLLVMGSL